MKLARAAAYSMVATLATFGAACSLLTDFSGLESGSAVGADAGGGAIADAGAEGVALSTRRRASTATPQTNGDCNSCHTEAGSNKAPGRVMTP